MTLTPETGLPILRTTACTVGSHVWITGANQWSRPEALPPAGTPCCCGLVAYQVERREAR